MKKLFIILAVVAMGIAMSSCSSRGGATPEEAVENYYKLAKSQDVKGMFKSSYYYNTLLSDAEVDYVDDSILGNKALIERVERDVFDFDKLELGDITIGEAKIEGLEATVEVVYIYGDKYEQIEDETFKLKKFNDKWYVSNCWVAAKLKKDVYIPNRKYLDNKSYSKYLEDKKDYYVKMHKEFGGYWGRITSVCAAISAQKALLRTEPINIVMKGFEKSQKEMEDAIMSEAAKFQAKTDLVKLSEEDAKELAEDQKEDADAAKALEEAKQEAAKALEKAKQEADKALEAAKNGGVDYRESSIDYKDELYEERNVSSESVESTESYVPEEEF